MLASPLTSVPYPLFFNLSLNFCWPFASLLLGVHGQVEKALVRAVGARALLLRLPGRREAQADLTDGRRPRGPQRHQGPRVSNPARQSKWVRMYPTRICMKPHVSTSCSRALFCVQVFSQSSN